MTHDLADLGWSPGLASDFSAVAPPDALPGRVCRIDRGALSVLTAQGSVDAVRAGRIFHDGGSGQLAVGDWVVLAAGRVVAVLPRRSSLARADVGGAAVEQVLAANVDVVFVVASMEQDLRQGRLERFLAFAWTSGAEPVVVLSKADACTDRADTLDAAAEVAVGVPIHPVSAYEENGLDELRPYLAGGRTAVLIGPSGVGKSTIVNGLARADLVATGEIRSDGKGRHTTTWRELVPLPGGGVLLDTPGLRGLALWDSAEGLDATFSEIAGLAESCRFNDCAHRTEPGCAVLAAVDDGTLPEDRLTRYRKMLREQTRLAARVDARLRAAESARVRRFAREHRGQQNR